MKTSCPNINSQEWQDLVKELNNSRLSAMEAFVENGYEIPALNSDVVNNIKKSSLDFGENVEVILDDKGEETDKYVVINKDGSKGSKTFNRISNFIKNFSSKANKDKSPALRKAESFWGSTPVDEKMVTDVGIVQTFQEYVNYLQGQYDMGAAKGTLIHLAIEKFINPSKIEEIQLKMDTIIAKFQDEKGRLPFNWQWIENKGVIEEIFNNVGINYFHDLTSEEDVLRDEIFSEVTVSSDEFGLAGTIDMLVKHSDKTHSIIDWKTGRSFNKVFKGMNDVIMKYGNQSSQGITDSIRNRSKLQLALYAVMLRSKNKNLQFRNLNLAWIPSEYNSVNKDPDMAVDVAAFIPMIESFLSDPILLKEAGLKPGIKDRLLQEDSNIFNPSVYSQAYNKTVVDEIKSGKMTPQDLLQDKLDRLKIITGRNLIYKELAPKDRKEAEVLMLEIDNLIKDPSIKDNDILYNDIDRLSMWIGNYSEMNHPMVQTWKAFKDKQLDKARKAAEYKKSKFRSLLRPVLEEYQKKNKIINILGNKAINSDELYKFMYVDQSVSEETSQTKERLLTSTEEDSDLQAKYNALSKSQKTLLDYVNEEFSSYFNGQGAFLNETATIIDGKNLSHLDLFNVNKEKKNKVSWSKGFFFKVPPTDDDIILRNGKGSELKGKFSKKTLGSLLYRYATFFREYQYEGWNDENQALPVKYMGNSFIDSSRAYTRNMEIIFSKAVENLEYKKYMDDTYALGKALQAKLEVEKTAEGQPAYKNLSKMFDLKLMQDIQRKSVIHNSRSRGVRIPMYTPNGWEQHKVSLDAVIRGLTKWASMNTMWLRPWQGTGNGVHAALLTHRDGLKGSISKIKLLGISGNGIDFGYGDIVKAEGLYFKDYIGAGIKNELKNSKMFLLAKEFDYFGNNFDYAEMEKTMLSSRNKFMNESSMYMFHSIPEEFVSLTTMAAQLLSMKNEVTGKSLYESYDTEEIKDENGKGTGEYKLVWNGGVRGYIQKGAGGSTYTEELRGLDSKEQAKIRKVHERLQGGYRKDEAALIEIYSAGKMMIHLKKYFPRLILNLYHSKRLETDLGYYKQMFDKEGKPVYKDENGKDIPVYEWIQKLTEGRAITLVNVMFRLLSLGTANKDYKWSELSDEQKQNVIEAMLTMAILLGTYGAYLQMFDDDDENDPRKKWFKMYLVDNLSQQYNVVDLVRTAKTVSNPVAIAKLSDFTVNGALMIASAANYAVGNEDAAFTKRGDLRGWNNFVKTIPLLSSYKDVMRKFENTKDENAWVHAFGTYDRTRLK